MMAPHLSSAKDVCAFIRKRGTGGSETDFFSLRDVDGTKDDILADFRSRATKEFGLKENDLEL